MCSIRVNKRTINLNYNVCVHFLEILLCIYMSALKAVCASSAFFGQGWVGSGTMLFTPIYVLCNKVIPQCYKGQSVNEARWVLWGRHQNQKAEDVSSPLQHVFEALRLSPGVCSQDWPIHKASPWWWSGLVGGPLFCLPVKASQLWWSQGLVAGGPSSACLSTPAIPKWPFLPTPAS